MSPNCKILFNPIIWVIKTYLVSIWKPISSTTATFFSSDFGIRIPTQEQNRKYTSHYDINLMPIWCLGCLILVTFAAFTRSQSQWMWTIFTVCTFGWMQNKCWIYISKYNYDIKLMSFCFWSSICCIVWFLKEKSAHYGWGSAIMDYQLCFYQPKKRIF